MGMFLLILSFVIFIPFAEGVLLALLLREVHVRHPLPLVEPGYFNAWLPPKPKAEVAEPAESVTNEAVDAGEVVEEPSPAGSTDGDGGSPQPGASVFDDVKNVPNNLPVNDAINAMTANVSDTVPQDLESRIEETTRLKEELPQEIGHVKDDMDLDDLNDLVAALPKAKIDFSQEHGTDPGVHEEISPMAKELLGENFDFNALEQQALKSHANLMAAKETNDAKAATTEPATTEPAATEPTTTEPTTTEPATTEPAVAEPTATEPAAAEPVTAEPAATEPTATEPVATESTATEPATAEPVVTEPVKGSAEVTLDIQEDNSGNIQVSSPFFCTDDPQLADCAIPQMVLPMFSDDWIQVIEPEETDAAHFSFSEELQPMFMRKKKAN